MFEAGRGIGWFMCSLVLDLKLEAKVHQDPGGCSQSRPPGGDGGSSAVRVPRTGRDREERPEPAALADSLDMGGGREDGCVWEIEQPLWGDCRNSCL